MLAGIHPPLPPSTWKKRLQKLSAAPEKEQVTAAGVIPACGACVSTKRQPRSWRSLSSGSAQHLAEEKPTGHCSTAFPDRGYFPHSAVLWLMALLPPHRQAVRVSPPSTCALQTESTHVGARLKT